MLLIGFASITPVQNCSGHEITVRRTLAPHRRHHIPNRKPIDKGERHPSLHSVGDLFQNPLRTALTCANAKSGEKSLTSLLKEFRTQKVHMLAGIDHSTEIRLRPARLAPLGDPAAHQLALTAHCMPQKYVSTVSTSFCVNPSRGSTLCTSVGIPILI